MTEIVNGELRYNELTQNANGGTELMARRIARDIPQELLKGKQIIFSRVRELEPDLKKILYAHDLANDPEVAKLTDPKYLNQFEKIVFVSNWQQHTYNMVLGVPFYKSLVIPNAIEEIPFKPKTTEGPIKLIYHTTPHRGLNILVAVFEHLQKHFDITLDVYSSFKAYGWEERDREFTDVFNRIDANPLITNHGFQPNEVVRKALQEAHVFAYPNTWPETSCLALIEAMCAGCFCLHSNLAALPETSRGLTNMYMYNEILEEHANKFVVELANLLNNIQSQRDKFNLVSENFSNLSNRLNSWETVAKPQWIKFLSEIKNEIVQ